MRVQHWFVGRRARVRFEAGGDAANVDGESGLEHGRVGSNNDPDQNEPHSIGIGSRYTTSMKP